MDRRGSGQTEHGGNPGTKLRRTGQAQLSEFIHAAPRCEHSAFFSQELRHQVLDLATLELKQGVDKVAVDQHLERHLEAMVYLVEAQRFPHLLVTVATHGNARSCNYEMSRQEAVYVWHGGVLACVRITDCS